MRGCDRVTAQSNCLSLSFLQFIAVLQLERIRRGVGMPSTGGPSVCFAGWSHAEDMLYVHYALKNNSV